MSVLRLRACLKTRPVRGPGLQGLEPVPVCCRPRALTRRFVCVFKQALSDVHQATALLGLLLACFINPAAHASIRGSAHDFSSQGWSQGETCIACHTPHNASKTLDTPLWNHATTTASFTLYSSSSLHNPVGQPGPHSKSCLSCHDGTVAVDSFAGGTGTLSISGSALIGTDLSNDHPVGITMYHEAGLKCQNCHQTHPFKFVSVLPFYEGKVECASCHDPHNNGVGGAKMLRKTITGSLLCLHCHPK